MKVAACLAIALLVLIAWTPSPVSFAGDGRNLSSVNGEVNAKPGETYDTISTVNGSVHVGERVTANKAETVNGELEIDNDVKLGSASTVNGSLSVGENTAISGEASTVNGSVTLRRSTRVGGDVSTVSGEIELRGAEVGGKVITHNGDIDLSDGAQVRGGIHVKKSNSGWGWSWGKDDPIKVHVCATCVVDGELRFDRPAELRVDQGGRVGKVTGDDVKRL